MKISLHPEALADLLSIRSYIAARNPRRASTFVGELLQKIEGLAHTAESHPVMPRYERAELRRRIHGQYRIVYRILADEGTVDVIHVLHTARDQAALLSRWE